MLGILEDNIARAGQAALVPADVDGDGRTDLVLTEFRSPGNGELLWLKNSPAGWVRHSITSDPPRIQCPGVCTANFNVGSNITLIAAPEPGAEFDGWVTAAFCPDTESPTCTFTVNPLQTISASFLPAADPDRTLTVTRTGEGTLTREPAGIACDSSCTGDFLTETNAMLTAVPDPGWVVAGWAGASCPVCPACTLSLNAVRSLTARFEPEADLLFRDDFE